MVKEIIAGAILAAMVTLSAVNVVYIDRLADELTEMVESADTASDAEAALGHWESMQWYTNMVLRHSEIDFIKDDFYKLISAFNIDEDVPTAKKRLVWRLNCMSEMETPGIGTVI